MSKITWIGYLLFLAAGIASASEASPYVDQQQRKIKALSPQEVQDYVQGKGMGFAKAAELNHYPGPAHVLQLSGKLQLTGDQKVRTETIHAAMDREAKTSGTAIVEKERELDSLFASGNIDALKLRLLVQEIGHLQAEVRNAHLRAHLEQKAVLTPSQIAMYDQLRGYTTQAVSSGKGSHVH